MGTTIEDITNAADVGKGTFFNYFPSKEHILIACGQLKMERVRSFVTQHIDSKEPMDRLLFQIARTLTEDVENSPLLVRAVLVPVSSSEPVRMQIMDKLEQERQLLAELIGARQKRGQVRGDLASVELARQFQQALFGTVILWSLAPSKPLSECLKEMLDVLWSGIRFRS